MKPTLGRLGPFVRARPRRSAALAGVLVLALMILAATLIVRSGSGTGNPGTSEAGGSGAGASAPGDAGGGTGGAADGRTTTGSPDRGAQPESTALPDGGTDAPTGASAPSRSDRRPGTDPVPVEPRTPVRCASTGAPTAGPLPSVDERDGRRWVTVSRLAGNCDAASPSFRLQGIGTRLAWRSDADSFAVFVVDVVQGREATAGFADGQCAGQCSESQAIVPPAGDYTLEVQAGLGPWEVEIQEYRRPS